MLEQTADEIRKATGVKVTAVPGDITTEAGRTAALAACPDAGYPGQQRRRTAAGRFPRLGPRCLDPRARRQHADADLHDQGGGRWHDRAKVRPHRQHHLGFGEVADPATWHEQRRPRRADRLRRRRGASDGEAQRYHQNILPGPFLTDRLRSGAAHLAQRNGRTVDEELALRGRENPTGRIGDPAEFGEACAFLCAASLGLHRRPESAAGRRRIQLVDRVMDPSFLPAHRLAALVRAGEVGCLELLDHFVARVEGYDRRINAVVVRDFERAHEAREGAGQSRRQDRRHCSACR